MVTRGRFPLAVVNSGSEVQPSLRCKKSDNIQQSAHLFEREAKKVRCQMLIQKWRWIVLGTIVALVVIFIIVWICCGAKFQKCKNSDTKTDDAA
jgi:uncharacterized membrane protein YvbJ